MILVPATTDELRQIVGTTQDLSQIAALATAEISTTSRGQSSVGDRVAINPPTFGTLGALGRRVVMTHEITHVATRSVTAVGTPDLARRGHRRLRGVQGHLDLSALRRLRARPRGRPGPPAARAAEQRRLRGRRGQRSLLAVDYEESWLACRFIVSRTSEAALIAFYKAVGTGQGAPEAVLKAAFADVLHTDEATFTASWRSSVAVSLK